MTESTATVTRFCHACGNRIDPRAEICPSCGVRQHSPPAAHSPLGPMTPAGRNRIAAALFALLLGSLGIHKFYLGRIGQGILYVLFCWTFIPTIIGFIEGILYLTMSDAEFAQKYG